MLTLAYCNQNFTKKTTHSPSCFENSGTSSAYSHVLLQLFLFFRASRSFAKTGCLRKTILFELGRRPGLPKSTSEPHRNSNRNFYRFLTSKRAQNQGKIGPEMAPGSHDKSIKNLIIKTTKNEPKMEPKSDPKGSRGAPKIPPKTGPILGPVLGLVLG